MPGFKTWNVGEVLSAASLNSFMTQQNIVIKAADQSVTSLSMVDDTHLLLAVTSNTRYIVEGGLVYSAADGVGMNYGWTYPSGSTMWWNSGSAPSYDAQGTAQVSLVASTITSIASCVGLASGGVSNPFRLMARPYGLLQTAASGGNLRIRFSQQTANGSDATVMRAGSWLRITKVS